MAERRLAASNARIGEAVAEYYPKFSLSALLGSATAVSGGNLFTGDSSQAAGALGLRWRLFDFGRINAQIDQAKGRKPKRWRPTVSPYCAPPRTSRMPSPRW